VPFDALPQLERQFGVGRVPLPAFGKVRHDSVQALVRLEGIEHDEIVVYGRKRRHRRDGRFFVQRGAGRIVELIKAQRAATLLCGGRVRRDQEQSRKREQAEREPAQ
jgi:hypothetical protein